MKFRFDFKRLLDPRNLGDADQLSVLACVTGLVLIAVWALLTWQLGKAPQVLGMLIASVGGFEIFNCAQGFARRRSGGGRG